MKLQENDVLYLLENPSNKNLVELGRIYESKLRLFTEPKFKDDLKGESAWRLFVNDMQKLLSSAKNDVIKNYIQYPLTSTNITASLMSDLYKVFNAGNSFFNVETVKLKGGDKINQLLLKLDIDNWIERVGKKVLKNKPNSIVVIDRDEDKVPYLIEIDNNRLIDFKLKHNSYEFEYIVFLHSIEGKGKDVIKRIAVYDSHAYYVVKKTDDVYQIETINNHDIGVCPARMFIRDNLNSNSTFNKKIPLSLALSKLNEWQLFDIYKFYTDHYAPFPVVEMVRAECGNPDCNKGMLEETINEMVDGQVEVKVFHKECPKCQELNRIGVGARILIENVDKDEPTASGKFRMISNDIENLTYLQTKLDNIERYIKQKVVGVDDIVSKEAINEMQVKGSFESRTNVLLGIKDNLDSLYKWIVNTVALLEGVDNIEVSANFGTEWYLVSEDALQSKFKSAIEIGLPIEEVEMIYNQLIETKYKGNDTKIERLRILKEINPLPFFNTEIKKVQLDNGSISEEEFVISERLRKFVNEFETVNGSIVNFGSDLERVKKINKINETLTGYAKKYIKNKEASNSEQVTTSEARS